jgi:hypothetical protein
VSRRALAPRGDALVSRDLGKHVAALKDASSRRDWQAMDAAVNDLHAFHQAVSPGQADVDDDDDAVRKTGELVVRVQRLRRLAQREGVA